MKSYFLKIEENEVSGEPASFSGSLSLENPALCSCPNCNEPMFPVFTLNKEAGIFPENPNFYRAERITLDVCASCSHSLKNYYIKFEDGVRTAHLGYIDGRGVSNKIDKPFQSRKVSLLEVAESEWRNQNFVEMIRNKAILDGVLHQLGGVKLLEEVDPISSCLCCGGELSFFAKIDYDDLNVPLYEDGEPSALIIGDMGSLNVYFCDLCSSLNYGITT